MITKRQVTIKYHSELERPVTWVALVGFMGSGKSRIGAELSRKLHLNFIDTDRVIERVSCMKIPDIFELYGEATFRDYESEIVRRSCRLDDAIVSTGGGTVVRQQNRDALKKRGPVVLLTASAETTFQRTRRHKRPLLEVGNPIERINDLMAARKGFYDDVASFSVSTDGRPSFEVVEEIIAKLYQWKQEQEQHQMLKATEEQLQTQPQVSQSQQHAATEQSMPLKQNTKVLHVKAEIHVQQVLIDEQSVLNKNVPETEFSDQFLTESSQTVELDCLAEESVENQIENTQENSESTVNAQSVETEEDDLPGRDIYAEMIRDLMRDPRA